MIVGFHALHVVCDIVAPYGVFQSVARHVKLVVSHSVACAGIDAVSVVLVLCDVEVCTHTPVGSRCLVSEVCCRVVSVGCAIA